jgi:CDP-paratose synthetase
MTGKRILVTGGTGFIGQNLVEKLLSSQNKIGLVVRNKSSAVSLFASNVDYIESENNDNFTKEIVAFFPDIVIHLAAYSTSRDDIEAIEELITSNILFVSKLLDALRATQLELFINAASFSEYHANDERLSPSYFYSATKTAARFIIDYFSQVYKFKFANTILYSVYGNQSPAKKVIDYIVESLDKPSLVKMTAGEQVLDFINVDDVTDFYLTLIDKSQTLVEGYQEYRVGTGRGMKIKMLALLIERASKKKANIDWGAIEYRARDTMEAIANTDSAKSLGWIPKINIESGIKQYLTDIN